MPKEGIFAKVLKGGEVRPQDSIHILDAADTSLPHKNGSKTQQN
jgi:MOSC domain-containing protein YiiM